MAKDGKVLVDRDRPWVHAFVITIFRNLRDPKEGADMRIDIARRSKIPRYPVIAWCGYPHPPQNHGIKAATALRSGCRWF